MANYISALNGEQMDAALTDVALHNSEAWAVGTRNTIPVSSSDETYHNNAKYYAQVAQSAIPGTYTAAVRWDIAQGLAGEAQEQARANISAGASNRNLLDNPWFTVNQRSFTSVNYTTTTTPAYCVDRWLFGGQGALTYNSDKSLTVTINAAVWGGLTQRFDPIYKGLNVTFSIMLTNGTVVSGNGVIPSASGTNIYNITLNGSPWQVLLRSDGSTWWMELRCSTAGATATIRAVKLELGSYSTLANDVPPDYGEELKKCQYFFRRITVQDNGFIALGWATSATAAQFPNILGTSPMRAKPSATPTGAVYVRDPSGTDHAVSSFTVQYDPVTVCLQANTSGLTANTVARLRIGAGGRIDLSADL